MAGPALMGIAALLGLLPGTVGGLCLRERGSRWLGGLAVSVAVWCGLALVAGLGVAGAVLLGVWTALFWTPGWELGQALRRSGSRLGSR